MLSGIQAVDQLCLVFIKDAKGCVSIKAQSCYIWSDTCYSLYDLLIDTVALGSKFHNYSHLCRWLLLLMPEYNFSQLWTLVKLMEAV